MSAATDYNSNDEQQKRWFRWVSAGHTIVHERDTFRHRVYKKDLDPTIPVRMDGVQMIMSNGHALVVGDVLPERADLALDSDGNLLPQHEFEKRYKEFLNWFTFVEGSDPSCEYIPSSRDWISQTPDTFSESPGMVEIGFDATRLPTKERTHLYDSSNDKLVEIVKAQGDAQSTVLDAVKQLLEVQAAKKSPGRPRKESAQG